MAITFISLCNQVLRRLNEVEIAEAEFGSVRGVQALVKDAVRAALSDVNKMEFEWPFNAAEYSTTMIPGKIEYDYPAGVKIVDSHSFQLQKDEALGVGYRSLEWIDRDIWYKKHRDDDYEAGAAGRDAPLSVFPAATNGFGVTPSPDKAYTIRFRCYLNHTALDKATDTPRTPDAFQYVLVDGALYHLYMFKDNPESASVARGAFEQGIRDLQNIYMNKKDRVYDTRVSRRFVTGGGGVYRA